MPWPWKHETVLIVVEENATPTTVKLCAQPQHNVALNCVVNLNRALAAPPWDKPTARLAGAANLDPGSTPSWGRPPPRPWRDQHSLLEAPAAKPGLLQNPRQHSLFEAPCFRCANSLAILEDASRPVYAVLLGQLPVQFQVPKQILALEEGSTPLGGAKLHGPTGTHERGQSKLLP